MAVAVLELQNIKKSFSGTGILKGINLRVEKGEFITLLGSSGCGKTTTLRIISGLESPDSGAVILEGTDVTSFVPNKRDVNTVFQNYALFPHMNVEGNVGYSLKIRKFDKKLIKEKVGEILELVQLSEYAKRMPSELSGGQRQRVAIARSIIGEPKVLLLDEPLGALDLQLRRQMQFELKRLQKSLGITFIYITHDQEEALNMSDRIAVMKDGVFEQIGTPAEVYDSPKTAYVARFVGSANILTGRAECLSNGVKVVNSAGSFLVPRRDFPIQTGDTAVVAVRSEQTLLHAPEQDGLRGTVLEKSFSGGMLRITVALEDGTQIIASRHGNDVRPPRY
ncbi:MAG: ABC transporter ATP-binding protein, partial [Oscillospiraceae bacterium]